MNVYKLGPSTIPPLLLYTDLSGDQVSIMSVIEEPLVRICLSTDASVDVEPPVGRENNLVVVLELLKPSHNRLEFIPVLEFPMLIPFSSVKHKCYESFYRGLMRSDLSERGIRETLHEDILDQLFQVIHAAETHEVPILLSIYDGTDPLSDEEVSSFTPTAESAIEALEQVRLDAAMIEQSLMCAICWKDFAPQDIDNQLMVTRMPCSHYFHGDCILLWLHRNHLCPMCRYAMPVASRPPVPFPPFRRSTSSS